MSRTWKDTKRYREEHMRPRQCTWGWIFIGRLVKRWLHKAERRTFRTGNEAGLSNWRSQAGTRGW